MFQCFDDVSQPDMGPKRLELLRAEMAADGLDGFMIPRSDMYQGEYVAPCDERLAWLTGFTGSAGFCIATNDHAAVFTDSRYSVQVREQIRAPFQSVDWPKTSAAQWVSSHLAKGKIGFDPWLHSVAEIDALTQGLKGTDVIPVPSPNLINRIWSDRPVAPNGAIDVLDTAKTGQSYHEKCQNIGLHLRTNADAALVITAPDNLCWLLNIRGRDVAHNPIVQGFAILSDTGHLDVFMTRAKIEHLCDKFADTVTFHDLDDFTFALKRLQGQILVDKSTLPYAVSDILNHGDTVMRFDVDPVTTAKAIKNPTELSAARACHIRDAGYMCEFLCWLDAQDPGKITEIDVAQKLERIRRQDPDLVDISFDTISASGAHAALPHYRVTTSTNKQLEHGNVMLIDSGGQYRDGTTDITRTIAIGAQPDEIRAAFTRVLKGMIAISCLTFPAGTPGRAFDVLARASLWSAGQDFGHGTGHGVGHYLSVHEGPQGISPRANHPFHAGMIVSNEPGFYKVGHFGIRTENLLIANQHPEFEGFLTFETLTYVPIDRRLINVDMLSQKELDWINSYHQTCRDIIGPRLNHETQLWLSRATEPL